jgi:hypothetical protein
MVDEENNFNKKQENPEDVVTQDDQSDITKPEVNLQEAAENLRDEAKKIVDENKPEDIIEPHETTDLKHTEVDRDQNGPEHVTKGIGANSFSILGRKPIVIVLVIGAIVLSGFLLYSQIQLSNQAYKIENFNALWNQSLADLRSGNTSIEEYCNNRVHDEDICNRFKSLQYMN